MITPGIDSTLVTDALEYHLPPELVARYPVAERGQSRLLVLDRQRGTWQHQAFGDLPNWLGPGDALVVNRTRVRRARTPGRRSSGGRIELLWLHPEGTGWKAMAKPAGRLRRGECLHLDAGLRVTVTKPADHGLLQVEVPEDVNMEEWLELHGHVPLPPYLGREDEPLDRERYQTVFAREAGAVAAPTAGLHFTPHTFETLRAHGVTTAELLLHVGPGTFRPIMTDRLCDHRIDPEWYRIPEPTWSLVSTARSHGHRVVAVGTTVARALESAALPEAPALEGWTDLLIAPPFAFRKVDALLTNFHLPRSSLLALVAAFAGLDLVLAAYRAAVEEKYRFYSYGDAMLIL
jgi:S-adenosylmethionine:tRNA ribosyltransferase-isomerase